MPNTWPLSTTISDLPLPQGIMARSRISSMKSTIPLISCTPEEFWSVYDGPSATDDLAEATIRNVLRKCEQHLRASNIHYRLDDLLYGMLREAPHPAGRRYVATAVLIAYTKGTLDLLANCWMEKLFLPLLAIQGIMTTETKHASDSHFQHLRRNSINPTIRLPAPATVSSDLRIQVVKRDQHACIITKVTDLDYWNSLREKGITIVPRPLLAFMEIGHIIPFVFPNDLDQTVGEKEEQPCLRDLFQSWTQLDHRDLTAEKVNSPANAIFLAWIEKYELTHFKLYFDKQAFPDTPNKYMVYPVDPGFGLSNGTSSVIAEFPSLAESAVEPPDPTFLHVHASITKVLFSSGASRHYDLIDPREITKKPEMLRPNNEGDVAFLKIKLMALSSIL